MSGVPSHLPNSLPGVAAAQERDRLEKKVQAAANCLRRQAQDWIKANAILSQIPHHGFDLAYEDVLNTLALLEAGSQ